MPGAAPGPVQLEWSEPERTAEEVREPRGPRPREAIVRTLALSWNEVEVMGGDDKGGM